MIAKRGGNHKNRRARDIILDEEGLLTSQGVASLFGFQCLESRNSYGCPNNFECGSLFCRGVDGINELLSFRRPLWNPESKWKSHLYQILRSSSSLVDGHRKITFLISGMLKNIQKVK